MNRSYSIVFIFFFNCIIGNEISAQNPNSSGYVAIDFLYDADSLFSLGDTTSTLLKLKQYVDRPYNSNDYYYSKKLKSTLLRFVNGPPSKADICITLSNLYNAMNRPEHSFEYLELANNTHLPRYGGCANGMIMYKTKLSVHYANYYISIGAKEKAIECLVEYFLSNESYERAAAKKLKETLLTIYTQDEISIEIERGLENMKVTESTNGEDKLLELTFFGKTTYKYLFNDLNTSKEFYKNHYCIKILKYYKPGQLNFFNSISYLFIRI